MKKNPTKLISVNLRKYSYLFINSNFRSNSKFDRSSLGCLSVPRCHLTWSVCRGVTWLGQLCRGVTWLSQCAAVSFDLVSVPRCHLAWSVVQRCHLAVSVCRGVIWLGQLCRGVTWLGQCAGVSHSSVSVPRRHMAGRVWLRVTWLLFACTLLVTMFASYPPPLILLEVGHVYMSRTSLPVKNMKTLK